MGTQHASKDENTLHILLVKSGTEDILIPANENKVTSADTEAYRLGSAHFDRRVLLPGLGYELHS